MNGTSERGTTSSLPDPDLSAWGVVVELLSIRILGPLEALDS